MKRTHDPDAAMYVIDFAYSQGALAALGDPDALARVISLRAHASRAGYAGLLEQYGKGRADERRRGDPLPDTSDSA